MPRKTEEIKIVVHISEESSKENIREEMEGFWIERIKKRGGS